MKKATHSALIATFLVAAFLSSAFVSFQPLPANSATPSGSRLGFWIDERDMWSGVGLGWTPQQFVQNYFETSPYPSAMLWAEGFDPSGPVSPGIMGEATWLSQVASLAQSDGLNVQIVILFFVNLSGGTIDGVADQTSTLTQWMQTLGSHSNIIGGEYEDEYYGNTAAEEQSFYSIMTGAGYQDILNPGTSVSGVSGPILDYSEYPYFGGTIPTSLSSGSIGLGYGETGAPSGSTPNPAWTQSSVQAIVSDSPSNCIVLVYADDGGSGQPSYQLWNWSTLQGWIYSDPSYASNYILSTSSAPPPTSTTTTTSTTQTTSSQQTITSTTTSSATSSQTTTSSSSSTTTSTSTSSESTVTTSTTSSSSTSTSGSTTVTKSQPSSTTTSSQPPQSYTLTVVGGCPSTGAGTYAPGATASVKFTGVCDRNGGTGIRVTSWSLDGAGSVSVDTNDTSSVQIPMDSSHTLTFHTVSQYSLTLDYGAKTALLFITPPSVPGDDYWYDAGTVVNYFGTVGQSGSDVVGWALNGGTPVSVSGAPDFVASIDMASPEALTVILSAPAGSCLLQPCSASALYNVTVQADVGASAGEWVDGAYYPSAVTFAWPEGSVHNITAAEGPVQSSVRTSFTGWSGLSSSKSPTLMLTVNENGNLTAEYTKLYLISISFTDATGAPITPQSATVTGPSGSQDVGTSMTVWEQPGGPYTITSAIWMGWDVAMTNGSAFTVSQPGGWTVPLAVYPETIKVSDAYGLPLQGATVNVTTLVGGRIALVTGSNGVAQFKIPIGIFSATVSYLGANSQVSTGTEGSHSFTVTFLLSYPLVATFAGVSAAIAAYALLRLRRKKQVGGPQFFSD